MTAVPLLMPHPGRHRAEREPSPLTMFFRRAVAAMRRRLAVPARGEPAGAATALLASLWPCCVHCTDGSPCDPRDQHREPCYDCDDAPPAPSFTPRHASTATVYAGGRLLGDLPRRQPGAALPYVAPLVDRGPDRPPWYTTVLPVYGEVPQQRVREAERLAGTVLQ